MQYKVNDPLEQTTLFVSSLLPQLRSSSDKSMYDSIKFRILKFEIHVTSTSLPSYFKKRRGREYGKRYTIRSH